MEISHQNTTVWITIPSVEARTYRFVSWDHRWLLNIATYVTSDGEKRNKIPRGVLSWARRATRNLDRWRWAFFQAWSYPRCWSRVQRRWKITTKSGQRRQTPFVPPVINRQAVQAKASQGVDLVNPANGSQTKSHVCSASGDDYTVWLHNWEKGWNTRHTRNTVTKRFFWPTF